MSDFISGYLGISLIVVVLLIFVYGGICLIFRPLVLWYFKVYTIMSALKENNALLREIRDELREQNLLHSSSRHSYPQQPAPKQPELKQPKEEYSKYMPR